MITKLITFAILLGLTLACHKDDGNDSQKSTAKQITSFVFRVADNSALSVDLTATLDENARIINATVPEGTDITALSPTIEVSQKATVSPTGAKDFTAPVKYTVTAEDGSTADYQATVNVGNAGTNKPPDAFVLLQVANASIDVFPDQTFSWEAAKDPDGDMVTYDLYLDTQANPTALVAESISETTFDLTTAMNFMTLSLARNYFWKVVAKDGKGGETASEIFTFKVQNLNDAQQLAQTTAYAPRSNHASVVFASRMWVLGGLDQGNDLNDAWRSENGTEWTFVNELSTNKYTPRFFHDAVDFDDSLWVMGGLVGGSFANDVWKGADGNEWSEVPQTQPFTERSEHTITEHDEKMWVIAGGNGNGLLADVWSSTDGSQWDSSTETAAFGERKFHQTVSFQGRLWVIAGQDDAGDKNDVWSSADGISWIEETPGAQFSPRGFHKALVFDDKIWIVGGGGLNDIWYSEDGVEWVDATPDVSFPAQGSFTALFYNNKIWILGGTPEVWTIDYHSYTN
jgi:hypothetical protein